MNIAKTTLFLMSASWLALTNYDLSASVGASSEERLSQVHSKDHELNLSNESFGCCTGPIGPRGPKGEKGHRGEKGPRGHTGAQGPAGVLDFADFYALMPTDNMGQISGGSDVAFPHDGPSSGSGNIARTSNTQFKLHEIGIYQVLFQVVVNVKGQLDLTLDSGTGPVELLNTVVGTSAASSDSTAIVGMAIIQTTVVDSILTVRNPGKNTNSVILAQGAGGSQSLSAHLVITQIQ